METKDGKSMANLDFAKGLFANANALPRAGGDASKSAVFNLSLFKKQ